MANSNQAGLAQLQRQDGEFENIWAQQWGNSEGNQYIWQLSLQSC